MGLIKFRVGLNNDAIILNESDLSKIAESIKETVSSLPHDNLGVHMIVVDYEHKCRVEY